MAEQIQRASIEQISGVVGSGNVVGVRGAGPTIGVLGGGNLTGVKGISIAPGGSGGYGGDFEGELYVDNQGVLYFCVAGGTPGSWNKVRLV